MTFQKIISKWPSLTAFAADVGVTLDLASKWKRGRGIPSARFQDVVIAARKRGYKVTIDGLYRANKVERKKRCNITLE